MAKIDHEAEIIAKSIASYLREQVNEFYTKSLAELDEKDPLKSELQEERDYSLQIKIPRISSGLKQVMESLFEEKMNIDSDSLNTLQHEITNASLFCQKLDRNEQSTLNHLKNSRSLAAALGITDQTLELFYNLGTKHLDSQEYEKASEIFWVLCILDEEIYEFWVAMGASEQEMEHWGEAIEAYNMAIKYNIDESPLPYISSATCYQMLGNNQMALSSLHTAKELSEKNSVYSSYLEDIDLLTKTLHQS